MIKLNIREIKGDFSKYINMVEAGETITVCKHNVPVAEIRPVPKKVRCKPVLGSAAGIGKIRPSFYEPMDKSELAQWQSPNQADPLRGFTKKPKKRIDDAKPHWKRRPGRLKGKLKISADFD
jgi:prevent-host-death family protein